jgi:hypothetical protein
VPITVLQLDPFFGYVPGTGFKHVFWRMFFVERTGGVFW